MKIFITSIIFLVFSLSSFSQSSTETQVYIFLAEKCPVCNYMGKPLKKIFQKYESENISFHAVFPVKNSSDVTAREFLQKFDLDQFEIIIDKEQKLTKKLGARVTPEAIITNGSGRILYKGRINDSYYAPGKMKHGADINDLEKAIPHALKGEKYPEKWKKPIGCFITLKK